MVAGDVARRGAIGASATDRCWLSAVRISLATKAFAHGSIREVVTDTHPDAEHVMVEHLRRMTPAARLHRASELRAAVLTLARSRIRKWYGDIDEREMLFRLASLWLDADTMRRVYDWDPDAKRF